MKMFFGTLDPTEYACTIDAPGVLTDNLFIATLVARNNVKDKEILLQRLNIIQRLENRRAWNTNLFFAIDGNAKFTITEYRQAIRKANKYSGYVRNSSAVGSKSSSKIYIPEPEIPECIITEEIDYLYFLTVGEFPSGSPGGHFLALTKDQKSETVKLSNKL